MILFKKLHMTWDIWKKGAILLFNKYIDKFDDTFNVLNWSTVPPPSPLQNPSIFHIRAVDYNADDNDADVVFVDPERSFSVGCQRLTDAASYDDADDVLDDDNDDDVLDDDNDADDNNADVVFADQKR